ncbi:TetR/AcrR family transcriptional regulator [Niveispirillum sp. KHB5.9]|uniref:TetR/AcrR family transcriptional regulator n=1 Tax=Niveispirillum sp. KHB5.9 TaxID=3400269 RepID=UPI003A8BA86A
MPPKKPLSARKQPSQRRSSATVDVILEAAARILEMGGLPAYNTNDIATVAGVSIGSLYQYFPNKEAITSALILRDMQALLAATATLASMPPGPARVTALIAIAASHQLQRPSLARILDREEERLPMEGELADVRDKLMKVVRFCMTSMPSPGPHTAEDVVAIIKSLVDAASRRNERDQAALVGRVNRAVFGYLGTVGGLGA